MSVYSHSRISSFENCPLQYRFRYIDRIPSEVEGVEALLGKLVHEVLETLYQDRERARQAGAAFLVERFDELWRQKASPSVRIVREKMTLDDYRAVGKRCIESYYRRHHPFDAGEVLGCEIKMEFSLDREGRYQMLGYIDRVDRVAPGILEIHDYKTGVLPRPGALRRDRQLSLYEIAARERWEGVREVRLVWHYLAHDRTFVERRDDEDLHRTRLKTIKAIQNIEGTVDFPARTSALCSWCEYRTICPEWRDRLAPSERPALIPPAPVIPPAAILPELAPGSDQYLLFGGSFDP